MLLIQSEIDLYNMGSNKVYWKGVFIASLGLLMSFIGYYFVTIDMKIIKEGTLINAPIESFSTNIKRRYSADVKVNGEIIYAGSIDENKYEIGDSISVYYLPGEYCVVQSKLIGMHKWYYVGITLFFLLAVFATIAAFLGKGRPKNKE